MKPKSVLRAILAMAGSTLLTITYASATPYYWDSNGDATAGFGTAAGTWSSTGTGNLWSTSPTGDGVGGGAVADYATTIADDLFFGTSFTPVVPPLSPFTGAITINGTVNAKSIFCSSTHANFVAGTAPVLNFPAEGRFEHATEGTSTLPAITLTGATTSMTWKAGFIDNFSIANVINNAAKNIIEGTGSSIVVKGGLDLGPTGTPLVFNGGGLKMETGFPYSSMSAFNAVHPITINPNVSFGVSPFFGSAFTVDMPLNLGTGALYIAGQNTSTPVVMTLPENHTGGTYLVSGVLQVSENAQLGGITCPLVFGSGGAEGGNGTLRITGTAMSDIGARPFMTTPLKGVAFEIVEATHTFTLNKLLNAATTAATLAKSGAGTLVLTENNTHGGITTITAGTLIINGDQTGATGATNVNSGSLLGGTGIIGGNVAIANTSGLTFNLSTAPGIHNKLDVLGTFTFAAGSHPLIITSSGGATAGIYSLITSVGTMSGPLPTPTLPAGWTAEAPYIESNSLKINITSVAPPSTPFQDWALAKGLDGTVGKENGEADDPDGDGKNNKFEFAFNGNPLSGSDNGMMAGLVQDASAPAGNELTLVVAVRDGATFANAGSPVVQTATVDGVTYTIEGSLDLVTIPGSNVSHSSGPSNTAPLATGLPSLTGTAWEYHTFKLDASEGLGAKGFLRAKAE